MRGFWGTAVLGGLVAAFVGYLYFFEYKKGLEDAETKKETARLFSGIKDQDVIEISLKNQQGSLTVKKDGVNWQIVEPLSDKADHTSVETYLAQLSGLSTSQDVDEGADVIWAVYGLDQPQATITLKASNKTAVVRVGAKKSYDDNFYVRLNELWHRH